MSSLSIEEAPVLADPAVLHSISSDLHPVPQQPALSTWDQTMNGVQVEGTG